MIEVTDALHDAVLSEAIDGLTVPAGQQKTIAPWLFYDERGSQLFEQITTLPEYYLTRTERNIFAQIAPSLPLHLRMPVTLAELGAGSASKTGILLREIAAHQDGVLYQPIDVSASALAEATASITENITGISVSARVANYLTEIFDIERPPGHSVLALYIGSSIGNFSPQQAVAILRNLRDHLQPGDALLLGADLAPSAQKTVATLLAAYDDAAGITAAFNRNVLTRLNRELNADFDLNNFTHRARWNAAESRIEMHLESTIAQTVRLEGCKIAFRAGETIHTENSYKFTEDSLRKMLEASGFTLDQVRCDDDQLFAVTLAEVA